MGPGDGIQKQRLLDLPTTIETAELNQRVSTSMRHAPAIPRAQRPILPPYNGKSIQFFQIKQFQIHFNKPKIV